MTRRRILSQRHVLSLVLVLSPSLLQRLYNRHGVRSLQKAYTTHIMLSAQKET